MQSFKFNKHKIYVHFSEENGYNPSDSFIRHGFKISHSVFWVSYASSPGRSVEILNLKDSHFNILTS